MSHRGYSGIYNKPRRRSINFRKETKLFIFQRVLNRRHRAMLPMTPSDRWLFLSQVMNHISILCPKSKTCEISLGMTLCSGWLCNVFAIFSNLAHQTLRQGERKGPRDLSVTPPVCLSSTFSCTCVASLYTGWLPSPSFTVMIPKVKWRVHYGHPQLLK